MIVICPICDKVVKKIPQIDRLPVNHEIWTNIQAKDNPDIAVQLEESKKAQNAQPVEDINLRQLQAEQEQIIL